MNFSRHDFAHCLLTLAYGWTAEEAGDTPKQKEFKTSEDMEQEREEFRVIIAGTRFFRDYGLLCRTCDRLLADKRQTHRITVFSGTARGADSLGERYAREHGYAVRRVIPDWEKLSTKAGIVRNCEMAREADALVAFWDGASRGTAHMIGEARRRGLAVRVIEYKNLKE